jgi:hypothetical protein
MTKGKILYFEISLGGLLLWDKFLALIFATAFFGIKILSKIIKINSAINFCWLLGTWKKEGATCEAASPLLEQCKVKNHFLYKNDVYKYQNRTSVKIQ